MNFTRSAFARRAVVAVLAAFAAALPQAVIAQSDPIVGIWHFVPERSRATPGPLPYKSITLNYATAGKDLKHDVEGAYADGRPLMATTTMSAMVIVRLRRSPIQISCKTNCERIGD